MSLRNNKAIPRFVPNKDLEIDWPTFNGGLNTFSKPTELKKNELAQADNMMLIGVGTPTGRWGSAFYNLAGSGSVRLLDAYYNSAASQNELLAITDSGLLVKKSGASYSIITGASFASGYSKQSVELGNNTYIASASQNFIKYNGTSLIPYVGVSSPTNVSVAFLSGATGYNTYSWVVTATSITGETLSSVNKTVNNLPLDMASSYVKVSWNTVSAAPSVLTGYNVYRGFTGSEKLLATLDPTTTNYLDRGDFTAQTIFAPSTDTTSGPKAKYIIKSSDRIILAGLPDDPSKVLISARYPDQDKFTAEPGGGYVYVTPNDGDEITGLGVQHLGTTKELIVVYKKYSTYVVTLDTATVGNFSVLDPQVYLLTNSFGASSGDSCIQVENDVFSFGRKGLYTTGQEPQYLNQIRTNEISARMRPYIQSLSDRDFREASAAYLDYKYILSFPSRREVLVYDRQRSCFAGLWRLPFGITKWKQYFDTSGNEKWIAGATDGNIYEFSPSYISDNGTTITKIMRTKREAIDWSMMKMLKLVYFLFRNVRGQVNVNILAEGRDGNTTVTKNFALTSTQGTTGWGTDQWGTQQWGQTEASIVLSGEELARYSLIYKQFRVLQIEVTTTQSNSNFEFLGFKATATSLGSQSLPSNLKV